MMPGENFVDGRPHRHASAVSEAAYEVQPPLWSDMAEEKPMLDLAVYWRLALKYRYVILGSFLIALTIGVALTLLMTPIYTARATLQIDRESARIFNAEEVSPSESLVEGEEFFQTQYGLLRSRSLAERVIESQGLANSDAALETLGVKLPEINGTASEVAGRRRRAAIAALQENLRIAPVRGSRLVAVGYDNPNPTVAAQIANAFAENFIQANLDRKFESSAYARQFLEERISQTKTRLEEAERQLVAYAANQQIINISEPGEASGGAGANQSLTSNNLVSLNNALSKAREERMAAEQRWRSASGSALMTLPEVIENPSIQRLSEQRALLDAEYQQKLSVFQPDYPEMVRLRAQIQEADDQIQTIANNI